MKKLLPSLFFLLVPCFLWAAGADVVEVDFLKPLKLDVNGAGPVLVKADSLRNRVILANTYTASVSIIDGATSAVSNVPLKSRIPQYLKDEAMAIDGKTGNVYIVGEKSVHVVFPREKQSITLPTGKQFEMAAIDENTGNAFLVGRESNDVVMLDLKKKKLDGVKVFDREEKLINLNATPPPPIRKVVCDGALRKVFVTDGYTNTLYTLSADNGKLESKRELPLATGARWHLGGYNGKTHYLYVVIETDKREVVQAAGIDVQGKNDKVYDLPKLTEGVGIRYNPAREEIYIPYDNHPIVHVVDFKKNGEVTEIKIPAYGNDASVIDQERQMLYVTSWAYAEIEVIDLAQRKLVKRVRDAGVLPHMFSMDLDTANRKLYVPLGATAVNGSHGAALTVFDVPAFTRTRLYTGWAPVDLIQLKGETSFLVFNSEDAFAEVAPDGTYKVHALPVLYPRNVIDSGKGGYYLSYGPHQSYWPVVYIWAAKNGILEIECKRIETAGYEPLDFEFFDRRIARLAQGIATDAAGSLWALQNSWGKEKLFLTFFLNGIRVFGAEERVELPADIERETSPRLIEADGKANRLYVVKLGEKDEEAGKLFVINPQTRLCEKTIDTGLTPADLAVDENYIYVSNFDSNTVSRIDKKSWETKTLQTGKMPLKMALTDKGLFVINHNDNTLERLGENSKTYSIPYAGKPDQLFNHGGKLVIASHDSDALTISEFDPATEKFLVLHEKAYPYGEATFDTANSSFYTRGQFGDSIFDITKIKADEAGRLWVTDFLSGKLFIVKSR